MKIFCWKYSKFLLAKSQWTGIRLRVNTFGDSQSPKNWTYTSPNKFDYLPPEKEETLSYFKWQLSSSIGTRPTPRDYLISHHCKLDTGMQEPNLHPELQMQQKLQVDLLLRPCQFHRALWWPGTVSLPK